MKIKGFVINLMELDSRPEEYEGLDLPDWVDTVPEGWLIVPLFGLGSMLGFIVLANPLVVRLLNWKEEIAFLF